MKKQVRVCVKQKVYGLHFDCVELVRHDYPTKYTEADFIIEDADWIALLAHDTITKNDIEYKLQKVSEAVGCDGNTLVYIHLEETLAQEYVCCDIATLNSDIKKQFKKLIDTQEEREDKLHEHIQELKDDIYKFQCKHIPFYIYTALVTSILFVTYMGKL